MEGTTIGRNATGEGSASEMDLEREFVRAFRETRGLHFVWTSSQNIDRLVTIFRAAKRTGRVLLIDLYTAVVLEATGRDSIPQSGWANVKLYIPHRQRVWIKDRRLFQDLERHKASRVFPESLPGLAKRAVMLSRPPAMSDRGVQAVLDGAALTYSLWEGYLEQDSSRRVMKWLDDHDIRWQILHTSGHASVTDLKRFGRRPERRAPSFPSTPSRRLGSGSSSTTSFSGTTASGGTFDVWKTMPTSPGRVSRDRLPVPQGMSGGHLAHLS